jgi:flavin-dependent dehydrogenase
MAKVHVIGAGPAGSIAAVSAIRSGFEVTVSEEHQGAGMPRNCSGLFSKDGLESLSKFLDYRKHVLNPIMGARISFDNELFSVKRKGPVAFVCDRSGIDRALARLAESEGAKMNFGERITSSFQSGNIIGADGPLSLTARHFGFPQIKKHAGTLQAQIPYVAEDPHMIEMHISNSRFPGFFAWVIPQNETCAEFGVGVELPHRPILAWNHLMKLKGIEKTQKPRGFVIPLSPRKCTAKRHGAKNVLLAGDAAGQVKSTTGGGVIFGGMCAAIAGRHAENPGRYEFEWRLRHGADLALHRMIHSFISSRSDAQLSAFCRRIKKLNLDSYLSHHGHMDRPTKMMGPHFVAHMLRNIWGVV